MIEKDIRTPVQSPRIRTLIGFSALIMLTFIVIVSYQASKAYRDSMRDAEANTAKLTHILADHVELTFLGVDLSLRRAIERQYFNTLFGSNLPEYTEQNFKIWLAETTPISALAMLNDEGAVEVAANKKGYEDWLGYQESPAAKMLLERMRKTDDSYVFIGRHTMPDNKPIILMSRRYNKISGDFGGIIVAAINPEYFTSFYQSIAYGNSKFMSIMLSDGNILAAGPLDDEQNTALTKKWLLESSKKGGETYNYSYQARDQYKIGALKFLKNIPVAVSIVADEKDFMRDWNQSRMKDIGFIVLFTIFGSILSFFAVAMAKQILRVQESEASAILASQAKSEFLANMSHELRTPLNAIIGFSEMINSGYFGPLNAKQKERVHDIHLCGSHLLQLITDILEFSKGDAGKLELMEEKMNVSELVDESVRIMNGKIKGKNITLIVATDPTIPPLWGDKRKIRQILLNLLSNALKFTPEGGTITATTKIDGQHNIHIIVTDTGIGIAEEDIPKALSVFGQVNRTKSHEGTGLGLPLCKMYTELHDGKLILTSSIGKGTTVHLIFPHQRTLIAKN
ncbi:MAG: sensor histidine kinase [Alphaproteobacteria bacterium]|nr:sensor histidine kinase [Alphaproteobacteria bacterium]